MPFFIEESINFAEDFNIWSVIIIWKIFFKYFLNKFFFLLFL